MPKDKYEYIKQVYNDEEIKKSNVFKNPIYQLDIVFEWF